MYKLHRNYRYALVRLLAERTRLYQSGRKPKRDADKRTSEGVHLLITMTLADERTTMEDLSILQRMRDIFDNKWLNSYATNPRIIS